MICMVAQSALLAQQDAVAPGAVVLFSTTLSVVGHVVLVRQLGWGLLGTAYSTTCANLLAAALLLLALKMRGTVSCRCWNKQEAALSLNCHIM